MKNLIAHGKTGVKRVELGFSVIPQRNKKSGIQFLYFILLLDVLHKLT